MIQVLANFSLSMLYYVENKNDSGVGKYFSLSLTVNFCILYYVPSKLDYFSKLLNLNICYL